MQVPNQILAEATRLFAQNGFDATSLKQIAEAVGIRKQSLLYHYPSKDVLRGAVLETMLSHWKDVLPQLLAAATSGEDQFDSVMRAVLGFFVEDPDRARLIVREVLDRPAEVKSMLGTHVRPWIDVVCNYIRKGQEQGRVWPDLDPEAYVVQVIHLVVASVATHEVSGALLGARRSKRVSSRHVDELLRFARRGMFRPEPNPRSAEE
jgi:AcrR family transcriptional regulator